MDPFGKFGIRDRGIVLSLADATWSQITSTRQQYYEQIAEHRRHTVYCGKVEAQITEQICEERGLKPWDFSLPKWRPHTLVPQRRFSLPQPREGCLPRVPAWGEVMTWPNRY